MDDVDRALNQSERQGGHFNASEVEALLSLVAELVSSGLLSRAEARHLRTLVKLPHVARESVRSAVFKAAQALAAQESLAVGQARQLPEIVALRRGVQQYMAGSSTARWHEEGTAQEGRRGAGQAGAMRGAVEETEEEAEAAGEEEEEEDIESIKNLANYIIPRMVTRFRGRGVLTSEEAKFALALMHRLDPVLLAAASLYADTGDEADFLDTLRRLIHQRSAQSAAASTAEVSLPRHGHLAPPSQSMLSSNALPSVFRNFGFFPSLFAVPLRCFPFMVL